MTRRWTSALLLAFALTTVVALSPQRAHASGSLGGITFPTGTNGCTGPLVGVYGASALQRYILSEAKDYCASFLPSQWASAPDVEYAAGGASCPGLTYAATNADSNEIGVSTVFADSCAADNQPSLDPSTLVDTELGVNVVEEIATCPGALEPNGGAVYPWGTPPCGGFSADPNAGSGNLAVSCSPAGLSAPQAQALYEALAGNEQNVGGCTHAATVQNRAQGAGDRMTWCFSVFGAGTDSCTNEGSAHGLAGTTGAEINDVCGPSAQAGNYAQGYVSRAAVVADPRDTRPIPAALTGCGVVQVGGQTGYNGACDPTNTATQNGDVSQAWSSSPTGRICNGDYAVATGQYPVWGYLHADLNQAAVSSGVNTTAQQFLQFMQNDADEVQEFGFLQTCQMGNKRTDDGGPYATTTPSC